MSGDISQNYELKQSNCNENRKQSSKKCNERSKTVNCNTKPQDSSSKANQFESKFPSTSRLNQSIVQNFFNNDTDSSDSEKCCVDTIRVKTKKLPPVGVFWDIENCQVPKGRSAVSVARLIRDLFFNGYREAEFVVVCDVKKESSQIIQELNDAQVTLIHVASTCKNAADEKLRQALRRFADTYPSPAAVILISGDINFAADLSDLRHRKKLHVILIHKENAADALILCASEHYNFTNITTALPLKEMKPTNESMEVIVRNLPKGYDPLRLRTRLKRLSDNCGGRVVFVSQETCTAVVRFNNLDVAIRAQRRMDGEDVYGNKISVSYPNTARNWDKSYSPYKIPARKTPKNADNFPPPAFNLPPPTLPLSYSSTSAVNSRKNVMDQTIWGPPKNLEYVFNSSEEFQMKQQRKPTGLMETCSSNIRAIQGAHGSTVLSDFSNMESWRPHSASFTEEKRSRTPNESRPWTSGSFTALNTLDSDDSENHMQSSNNTLLRSNSVSNNANNFSPTDLLVTNLDQNLDVQNLRTYLLSLFQECAMVLNLSVFYQSDGNLAANVRVASQPDAQYAISQLHRRKVGHKRIVISYAQNSTTNPLVLRNFVVSMLQEVPGSKMPLFKFRELLENRYRTSVPVSELYKLKDICNISDELGGRMISLNSDFRTTPSPHLSTHSGLESAHCLLHCPNGLGERGWAEPDTPSLPNVRFKLKVFGSKVYELLHSHMGSLPLSSFPVCYELENGEKLPVDESGVPLEHLITCVVGVDIRLSSNMVKYLIWGPQLTGNDSTTDDGAVSNSVAGICSALKCVSPPLATQLALFSRELVDLLKTAPHCQLPFSRFIPSYHHHFGRQCRVADYGHTKLLDLFESLPHVVQVLGEGNKRVLTLSHAAQLRRFTSDLLRVLKSQVSKQVALADFNAAYERVLSRTFDPVDYGLCELGDLLDEIPENTIVVKQIDDSVFVAIPKKEQTAEEIMKTKQFAIEVVDLLKHAPQYGMLFNKFVPAYHHHFGHQCRVSDYGFAKLIELFEAIPDIVKIEEVCDNERKVSLTPKEALKVLQQQLTSLVKNSKLQSVPLITLQATFLRQYGYSLRPELYECASIEEIIDKLSNILQLIVGPAGPMLVISEESVHQQLGIRIWSLLLTSPHTSTLSNLLKNFYKKFNYSCTLQLIENYSNIFEVKHRKDDIEVCLTPRYVFAARLYHLLFENGGVLLYNNIDGMYLRKYNCIFRPTDYDAANLNILLSELQSLVTVKGRRNKRQLSLNTNIAAHGIPLPLTMKYQQQEEENNMKCSEVKWPPPPAHAYLFHTGRTPASPPKPDTPPSRNTSNWDNSTWNISSAMSPLNLCIPLPFGQTPPVLDNPYCLTSPTKNLLPAFPHDVVHPPDPCDLPLPTVEFLNKSKTASPSKDSGISSTSFTNSVEEPDTNDSIQHHSPKLTPKKKRHLRLAAHFTTPLNLT